MSVVKTFKEGATRGLRAAREKWSRPKLARWHRHYFNVKAVSISLFSPTLGHFLLQKIMCDQSNLFAVVLEAPPLSTVALNFLVSHLIQWAFIDGTIFAPLLKPFLIQLSTVNILPACYSLVFLF